MRLDLKQLLEEVKKIVHIPKPFIEDTFGELSSTDVRAKRDNSLVTHVDENTEKILVKHLGELLPEAGFFTEEKTVKQSSQDLTWVVDPIDGTNNFIQGIPHFAISVALQHRDHVVLGVVYDIIKDELFSAYENGGAFLNDRQIHTSQTLNLAECTVGTGFLFNKKEEAVRLTKILGNVMENVRSLRRFGSAALDLCYVANGRFDAYYEDGLNYWDVAAGLVIVSEAGGRITDYSLEPTKQDEILCTNGIVHESLQGLIQEALT